MDPQGKNSEQPPRKEIPLKWVFYAILAFAFLQTFLLYIATKS